MEAGTLCSRYFTISYAGKFGVELDCRWFGYEKSRAIMLVNTGLFRSIHIVFHLDGPYAGGLDQLYAEHRECWGIDQNRFFPLLTKILNANDWLSVQELHPDDAYGMEHEGELGKTECWYIIAADEGAEIIYSHHAQS